MQVFKFGGASVKDAASIKNVASIIQQYQGKEKLLIVISAMGKTTNAFEAVVNAFHEQTDEVEDLFQKVKEQHWGVAHELFGSGDKLIYESLEDIFSGVHRWINGTPNVDYNFLYDQVVSAGELLSTILVAAYLNKEGVNTEWVDVRQLLQTDNTYREGVINWEYSQNRIQKYLPPILENRIVVTQGFLGGTKENFTTTLGREGSDYTAAVFSNMLNAEKMSVWKDVPGILSGDPRIVEDATLINQLSYYEAIEMTYYGAKVIHPKTIKPLQNKQIPLFVRSFKNPEAIGTKIHTEVQADMPPVVVFNKNQIQLSFFTKDFSFIVEENLSTIYSALAKHRIKTNLSQNGSISFRVCVDNVPYKIEPLIADLQEAFDIRQEEGLELVTVRHYTQAAIERFTKDREVLLTQKGRENVQLVVK